MLRLNYVHIRRFRNLAPDTRLEFGPGAVFLLGKNGTGKSTLLELLGRLISVELGAFRQEREPVDVEWELEQSLGNLLLRFQWMPGQGLAGWADQVVTPNGDVPDARAAQWTLSGR